MADTLNGIFFSEILADNAGSTAIDLDGDGRRDKTDEFIELTNASGEALNLDGLQVWSEKNGLLHSFGAGDTIAAGGTATVVGDYAGTPPPGFYDANGNAPRNFLPDGENNKFDTIFLLDTTTQPPTFIALSYGDPPRTPTPHPDFPTDAVQIGAGESVNSNAPNGTSILRDANGDLVEGTPEPGSPGTLCLARGSLIATPTGERAIEDLCPGDLVWSCKDAAFVILRAVGRQHVSARTIARLPDMAPIRIDTGDGRHLMLSANHRVRFRSPWTDLLFDGPVLVAAKWLAECGMAHQVCPEAGVDFYHLVFDRHILMRASGVAVESLYLGDISRRWIDAHREDGAWDEISPGLTGTLSHDRTALPCLRAHEARALLSLSRTEQVRARDPIAA